jgi:hypothetical protein
MPQEWLLQGQTCDTPDAPPVVPVVEESEGWGDLDAELSVRVRHVLMPAHRI